MHGDVRAVKWGGDTVEDKVEAHVSFYHSVFAIGKRGIAIRRTVRIKQFDFCLQKPICAVVRQDDRGAMPQSVDIFGQRTGDITQSTRFGSRITFSSYMYNVHHKLYNKDF